MVSLALGWSPRTSPCRPVARGGPALHGPTPIPRCSASTRSAADRNRDRPYGSITLRGSEGTRFSSFPDLERPDGSRCAGVGSGRRLAIAKPPVRPRSLAEPQTPNGHPPPHLAAP